MCFLKLPEAELRDLQDLLSNMTDSLSKLETTLEQMRPSYQSALQIIHSNPVAQAGVQSWTANLVEI